jgi:SAM-dependent MidA family methyltransferase
MPMSDAASPPGFTADELEHGARLAARIREVIADAGGWISFARYMEMALYEPGLGYYSAGARKLGEDGDFVTAPEVAPVFSACMAGQCAEILAAQGGGDVLELGAGSGAMAAAMLAEFESLGALPARYRILDLSADLRERQRAMLSATVPRLLERVEWLERLPEGFDGVVVANEVLDAMPVDRFVWRDGGARALGVAAAPARFEWAEAPAGPVLRAAVERIRRDCGVDWDDGYVSEVNTGLAPWLAAVAGAVRRGVVLFVDYGLPRRELYAAERSSGTLLCHFRHRFNDDPFARPGLQDITAWVDFTAVAEAAEGAGLELAGYTTQAHFLIGNDLAGRLQHVSGLDPVQRVNRSRQAMVLTLPGEMGERFKVIALAKSSAASLRGFAVRDLRHTL